MIADLGSRLRAPQIAALVALALAAAAGVACDGAAPHPGRTMAVPPAASSPSAGGDALILSGNVTLDGTPAEAQFLGARVVRADGLAAACQQTIPSVSAGRYQVGVLPDADVGGCGLAGARVVLWIFAHGRFFYSGETLPWPDEPGATAFDASFSTADPAGATAPATEFKGHLFAHNGAPLPGGTVVEAYAGDLRCGLTSLRAGDEVERFYTLIVAGPAAVPGCTEGARLSFRLNGEPAAESAVSDLAAGSAGHELDLTLAE
jgi:hypothetical protein